MLTCIEGQSQYINLNDWRAGEDYNIPLTVKDKDGAPIDLTDAVIVFTLSRYLTVGDPVVEIEVGAGKDQFHTDPEAGESNVCIPAEDSKDLSGDYYYSIKIYLPADDIIDRLDFVMARGKGNIEANTTSQYPEEV